LTTIPVAKKQKPKYNNIKTGGFDSRREYRRHWELQLLQRAGKIADLKTQVPYELIPKQDGERAVGYVADFTYIESGVLVVEDSKGFRTPDYVIKRKLMLWRHGIKIREV
jgi:hypothetical protein